MTFEELADFLATKMVMTHVYQAVLIRELVENGGSQSIRDLAVVLASMDESSIAYYERVIKRWPLQTLKKHGVIERDGPFLRLNVEQLSISESARLLAIAERRLVEFLQGKGDGLWDYGLRDGQPISNTTRYHVLKNSGGRCALCGATKDQRPLDVDHIIPRSRGGKNNYENLQVLCSRCNRSKRDRDDTDFRAKLLSRREGCSMCNSERLDLLVENDLAYAVHHLSPVTAGHTLVAPRRHVNDYVSMTVAERRCVDDLLRVLTRRIAGEDGRISGFDISATCGTDATPAIGHAAVHLIPKRGEAIGAARMLIVE